MRFFSSWDPNDRKFVLVPRYYLLGSQLKKTDDCHEVTAMAILARRRVLEPRDYLLGPQETRNLSWFQEHSVGNEIEVPIFRQKHCSCRI